LTPSIGMIEQVLEAVTIDVMVIIRPRGGDFLYSSHEWATIQKDIQHISKLGVKGIVFGSLLANGKVDMAGTQRAIEWAGGLDFTFHRAFDMSEDPVRALEDLMKVGVPRILSSGQAPNAIEGSGLLGKLQSHAGKDCILMAGGGILPGNVQILLEQASLREIHATCWEKVESSMEFRQDKVYMGKEEGEEYGVWVASPLIVRELLDRANAVNP
ncbi:MAG: copper homeostasis protein CutC, partial [Bacteroidota bacterium]